MNSFKKLATNATFSIIAGAASIISLLASWFQGSVFNGAILFSNLLVLLLIIWLVSQTRHYIGGLDVLDMNVYEKSIILERDEERNLFVSSDFVIAINANLSPETIKNNPVGRLTITYPQQLRFGFGIGENVTLKSNTSDKAEFNIVLNKGIVIITLKNMTLQGEEQQFFDRSAREIQISLETDFNNLKKTSVHVSTMG